MTREAARTLGIEVDDMVVGALQESDVDRLTGLLAEHGVVAIPNQDVDDVAFLDFLRSLGELMFTEGEIPVDGYPDLNVISNVGRTTPPRSTFHVDTTYVPNPPVYTALRAVEVPEHGGQTVFSDQYAAYSTLPAGDRAVVDTLTVTHTVTGLDGVEGSAVHPLVLVHPVSGRRSLYLSAPARCVEVSGMTALDAAEFVRYLVDHSTREDNLHRHAWAPGDVVIWDNRCVMHKADHTGVVGNRVMHRGMVAAPSR